jgi:hypothetical protein
MLAMLAGACRGGGGAAGVGAATAKAVPAKTIDTISLHIATAPFIARLYALWLRTA